MWIKFIYKSYHINYRKSYPLKSGVFNKWKLTCLGLVDNQRKTQWIKKAGKRWFHSHVDNFW